MDLTAMRLSSVFYLLFFGIGISAAQDTSFSAGPQYLVNGASTLFLRPIATPSLSFQPQPPAQVQESEAPGSPPIAANEVAPPEATPSEGTVYTPPPIQNQGLARIYWGEPKISEIGIASLVQPSQEPSSEGPPRALPASIAAGGPGFVSLGVQGYGASLGETAAFWKTHKTSAPRVYTNSDIERWRGE
jgi:hypothetical protein